MLNLEVLGSIWGRFGIDFGSTLAHGSNNENNEKPFFGTRGGLGWLAEASWALS